MPERTKLREARPASATDRPDDDQTKHGARQAHHAQHRLGGLQYRGHGALGGVRRRSEDESLDDEDESDSDQEIRHGSETGTPSPRAVNAAAVAVAAAAPACGARPTWPPRRACPWDPGSSGRTPSRA